MTFSPQQIAQLRQETPACQDVIHFNNAGASLTPLPVSQSVYSHLQLEERLGGYEAAAINAAKSQAFYPAVARLLNTNAQNIAFASSATDAYNRALTAIPFAAGDLILTTENDYVSNHIAFLQIARRFGVEVLCAREDEQGGVDIEDMLRLIREKHPKVVAVTHMPTSSGLIQDIEMIGRACQQTGSWYLVDACQTAGQLPLDVNAIACDFLSATFRKFLRGPRGTGFLYVSDRALAADLYPQYLDLHSARWTSNTSYEPQADAPRFEQWERNHALIHGATAAAVYAQQIGLDKIADQTAYLARQLREQLQSIPQLQVLDQGKHLGAIVTCYHPAADPQQLLEQLRARKIHTSINWLDYARYDFQRKGVPWALRLSPHYYNTIEEINNLSKEIFKIIC
jgi:selenocysteine lyase/cysteine desulfurase